MTTMRFKKLHPDAVKPLRQTAGSVGFDLYSIEDKVIRRCPYKSPVTLVRTGIAIQVPEGCVGDIRPRSSLAAKFGISVANSPGTIDWDFRGELTVPLINHSGRTFEVEKFMRIAQLVILPVLVPNIVLVDDLDDTVRGAGGFGSTGR